MGTVAILPVKRFTHAKQRLHPGLGAAERSELAAAMVGDVLEALAQSRALSAVVMVTAEPRAAELARSTGASVVADRSERGQSEAAILGVAWAVEEGYDRVLLVPGDCPTLSPRELEQLLGTSALDSGPARRVVIVPDRHGTGTNGLLLEPPDVITPAFGPGSFARHVERASEAGAACEVARPASLLLDIDTGEDLDTLRSMLPRHEGTAPRTRAALHRLTAQARVS